MHFSLHYLDEADSTNREFWRMIEAGPVPAEGRVLQAGNQTAGRGLGDNRWMSEPGQNLTISILLKPVFLSPARQFFLNKSVAVGIRNALSELCPDKVFKIKWPNDVVADNKKVAGTLIENRIMGQTYELSIVGIGINVNQTHFPPDLPNPTSLSLLCGKKYALRECLDYLLHQTGRQYERLAQGHLAEVDKEYLHHLLGYGQRMRFRKGEEVFEACIASVNEYGRIVLQRNSGKRESYEMKEVQMLPE